MKKATNLIPIPEFACRSEDVFDYWMAARLEERRMIKLAKKYGEPPKQPSYMDDSWGDYDTDHT